MRQIPGDHPDSIALAANTMRRGGVIVLPTDTLYGLSAALGHRGAYERIVALKASATGRRFIGLADSIDRVAQYVAGWGAASREALAAIWPAALTVVLPAGPECPEWFGNTVAFRVPDSDLVRRVVAALGEPIVSTSVNRGGEPPMNDVKAIERAFGNAVDLLVVGKQAASAEASTVVDLTVSPPGILRQGGYAWPTRGKPSN